MSESPTDSKLSDVRTSSPSALSAAVAVSALALCALALPMVSVMAEAREGQVDAARHQSTVTVESMSSPDTEADNMLALRVLETTTVAREPVMPSATPAAGIATAAFDLNASNFSMASGPRDIITLVAAVLGISLLAWRRTLRLHRRRLDPVRVRAPWRGP